MILTQDTWIRIILTAATIILAIITRMVIIHAANKALRKALHKVQEAPRRLLSRLTTTGTWLITLIIIIVIWGGSIENVWVTTAGIFGIVAIGFFAVWSILSNIVAGAILMLIKNIDIGEDITIHPENIRGRIKDITAFFVVLEQESHTHLIPNNLFIQKMITKHGRTKKGGSK